MGTFQEHHPVLCGSNLASNKPKAEEVPSHQRPWNIQNSTYNPKLWNETCRFDECDPGIKSSGFQPKFNTVDGKVNRRRAKACGESLTYNVSNGFPLNPAGRTGLTGRGILPRYGPNHMMSVIFVWETGNKVLVPKKSGRNSSYGDGFITGIVRDPEEQPFPDMLLPLIKKSLKEKFSDTERVNKILKNAKKRFVKLVGGSVPSSLETDHAWVELQMFLVPCKKTKKLCRHGLLEIQEEYGLQWYEMKTENAHALNQSITSLISKKPENQERYSIFCEAREKNRNMLSTVFATILLIGAASGAVALTIALAAVSSLLVALGWFFTFCLLSNGALTVAALYDENAE